MGRPQRTRVVGHYAITVGDYLRARVNLLNLLNDAPHDIGIAGVDTFKKRCRRKAIEHWTPCNWSVIRDDSLCFFSIVRSGAV
jgi:hypothetical protein